jgi:hypothetical protein
MLSMATSTIRSVDVVCVDASRRQKVHLSPAGTAARRAHMDESRAASWVLREATLGIVS